MGAQEELAQGAAAFRREGVKHSYSLSTEIVVKVAFLRMRIAEPLTGHSADACASPPRSEAKALPA